MIHALFIAFLIIVLFLMYKNDNDIINNNVDNFKQEAFHSKSKNFTHNPYKSKPEKIQHSKVNDLLTVETTGIDRSELNNTEEMEYLGEIESRPAYYSKLNTQYNDYKILNKEDDNLRYLFDMKQYYK
tara:strand:- start:492 stop:875 length:384 start_codon:yes stop_codon:yes gene_type:complete